MKRIFFVVLLVLVSFRSLADDIKPTRTVMYAHRDTCDLYLDYYAPNPEKATYDDGSRKPTIMFAFGGGFMMGSRNDKYFLNWFKMLTKAGFGVVSIDYRLGLKGMKFNFFKFIKATDIAVHMAVEDMFSATNYLIQHGHELGIDPSNIVTSGSSAGAITALQAEYEIANRSNCATVLPPDFNYAGVMSFSGAIYSTDGDVKYKNAPCPQLLMHGTKDKMVPYTQIQLFNLCFAGSKHIARTLRKGGYVYSLYSFVDNMHEISAAMENTFNAQLMFLNNAVHQHKTASMDVKVKDPQIPVPDWAKHPAKSLY